MAHGSKDNSKMASRNGKRSPLGWLHIGIYAYRVGALKSLTGYVPCELELRENLEQLRALWLGMHIQVGVAASPHGPGVDTPEDLAAAESYVARMSD